MPKRKVLENQHLLALLKNDKHQYKSTGFKDIYSNSVVNTFVVDFAVLLWRKENASALLVLPRSLLTSWAALADLQTALAWRDKAAARSYLAMLDSVSPSRPPAFSAPHD